jgi:hypothetical protein
MKIVLSALVMFALAVGSPSSSHAAEAKAPAKSTDKKPEKSAPTPGPEKKKDGTNTADAFKFGSSR